MTDKQLTEKQIFITIGEKYAQTYDGKGLCFKSDVQSAKRLLKSIAWNTTDGSYICKLCQRHTTIKSARNGYCIWCEIDACFQIYDNDKPKARGEER
jgi:hypothetical protein